MARRTFFSFHYQEDVWRVFNVRNCLVVSNDQAADGFFDGSVFEASQKEGDEALKTFLRNGLKNTSVTCVLAGQYTAGRRWVRYEVSERAPHLAGGHPVVRQQLGQSPGLLRRQ